MPTYRFVVAVGTRPEAIKLAPLVRELRQQATRAGVGDPVFVCATGQHAGMVKDALAFYGVTVNRDLGLLFAEQTLATLSARILKGFAEVLEEVRPQWVVVQGDTATTAMAGLAAFYAGIRVAHVEAGLRTNDLNQPFPEEFNRRMVTLFAAVHFAATPTAKQNLLREGVPSERIFVTGNTGIDALYQSAARLGLAMGEGSRPGEKRPVRVLVTAHRRENLEHGIENVCMSLRDLVANHPGRYQFVWPLHPNPAVGERARRLLTGTRGVTLVEAASYDRLLQLLSECDLVVTDSGGIQEEAPSFGKPVLILREKTERPEGVEEGIAWLTGCDPSRLVAAVERLTARLLAGQFEVRANPYGDGHASARIADYFAQGRMEEYRSGSAPAAADDHAFAGRG